jgi:enterochelin esterase family protein
MLKEEFDRNNALAFADPSRINKTLKLFWIGVGREDGLYPVISEYLNVLNEKKIRHETLISDGGHTWMNCKTYLSTITQKLFK